MCNFWAIIAASYALTTFLPCLCGNTAAIYASMCASLCGNTSYKWGEIMELRLLEYFLTVICEENVFTSVLAWKKLRPYSGTAGKFLEYIKRIHSEHMQV